MRTAAAYAIAAGVHLLTLALLVAGTATLVVYAPNLLAILLGLALLGAGAMMRPRVPRMPAGAVLADAPELHALAQSVAAALNRPPPDVIVVDLDWNAAWTLAGWRRRRVLVLGLPMLAALGPQPRVALIAHELGHDRNGDVTRGLFVGSAVNGLRALSWLLRPSHGSGFNEGAEWLTGALMSVVRAPVDAVLWLEYRLLTRDLRRAEYLADARAAQVAGTPAVIGLHERQLDRDTFAHAIQRAAVERDAEGALDRFRTALEAVPAAERERRLEAAGRERSLPGDTHPTTAQRIAALAARDPLRPLVTLDAVTSARIDAELAPLEPEAGRALVDRYRASLH